MRCAESRVIFLSYRYVTRFPRTSVFECPSRFRQSQQWVACGYTCHSTGAPAVFAEPSLDTHSPGGVSVSSSPIKTRSGRSISERAISNGAPDLGVNVKQPGYNETTAAKRSPAARVVPACLL